MAYVDLESLFSHPDLEIDVDGNCITDGTREYNYELIKGMLIDAVEAELAEKFPARSCEGMLTKMVRGFNKQPDDAEWHPKYHPGTDPFMAKTAVELFLQDPKKAPDEHVEGVTPEIADTVFKSGLDALPPHIKRRVVSEEEKKKKDEERARLLLNNPAPQYKKIVDYPRPALTQADIKAGWKVDENNVIYLVENAADKLRAVSIGGPAVGSKRPQE